MSSTLNDVKDFILKQISELADSDLEPEELARRIERAKATSLLAGTYIGAVKAECDALRLADDIGLLPSSIDPGRQVRQIEGPGRGRPRLVSNQ